MPWRCYFYWNTMKRGSEVIRLLWDPTCIFLISFKAFFDALFVLLLFAFGIFFVFTSPIFIFFPFLPPLFVLVLAFRGRSEEFIVFDLLHTSMWNFSFSKNAQQGGIINVIFVWNSWSLVLFRMVWCFRHAIECLWVFCRGANSWKVLEIQVKFKFDVFFYDE